MIVLQIQGDVSVRWQKDSILKTLYCAKLLPSGFRIGSSACEFNVGISMIKISFWTLILTFLVSAPAVAQHGAPEGQWPTYGGDLGHTRYSGLDQINSQKKQISHNLSQVMYL